MATIWLTNGPDPFRMFAVRARTLNAVGQVEVRGWGDPAPHYKITFNNEMVFDGTDEDDVFNKARAYAFNVHRLTGRRP